VVLSYATTVRLWPDWHPQSIRVQTPLTRPLQQGDQFREWINTPLGINRVNWHVSQSHPGAQWTALGSNLDQNIAIALTYQVVNLTSHRSRFERTLQYTLPNFVLVVANAVYFKKDIETQSVLALNRLQQAIESTP
jgi:hypothetical protein